MVREASLKQIMVQEQEAGMYALYCEQKKYEDRLVELLKGEFEEVRVCSRWEEFLEASRTATCSIVEAKDIYAGRVHQRLFQFCTRPALHPLVLVTALGRANTKALTALCVDELVYLDQTDQELLEAVLRAESRDFLTGYAHAARERNDIPAQLQRALVTALTSPRPITSQKELVQYAHCHRSTLIRQWRTLCATQSLAPTLKLIALVRAGSLRETGMSWNEIAEVLSIPPSTLSDIADRLMGCRLGELDLSEVKQAFRQSPIVRRLLN